MTLFQTRQWSTGVGAHRRRRPLRTHRVVADEALPDEAGREGVRDAARVLAGPVGKRQDAVAVGIQGRKEARRGLRCKADAQHGRLEVGEWHGAGAGGVELGKDVQQVCHRDLVPPAAAAEGVAGLQSPAGRPCHGTTWQQKAGHAAVSEACEACAALDNVWLSMSCAAKDLARSRV